jgi:protein associated with RNAse G/E
VWIVRRKWPDSPHYEMTGDVLGEDEHGDLYVVWCLPRDDWFLLHFWHGHPEVEIYVDICTPGQWTDDRVTVIDLDFDVIAWNAAMGGHVELVDEDEFEEHRLSLEYPAELQDNARRAAADVFARAQSRRAPFTLETAQPWLAQLGVLG